MHDTSCRLHVADFVLQITCMFATDGLLQCVSERKRLVREREGEREKVRERERERERERKKKRERERETHRALQDR